MQKFKSKKGFTLAELLIVVAIIAVLTAIAVPLFVGSLNKAEENVKNANIRAVRGAAVVYILSAPSTDTDIYDATGAMKTTIYVQTTVSKTGEIGQLEFLSEKPTEITDTVTGVAKKDGNNGYTVIVSITKNDISKKTA